MADPEARVVVTARDATAAGLASADRGLKTFGRSLQQVRRIAAGFGLVFTGRMFAGWVRDAIEVEKLTAEQAVAIDKASKAASELNSGFQDLARTVVAELAPGLETAARFWKEFLFPTGSQFGGDAFREQIDAQLEKIRELERTLEGFKNKEVNGFAEAFGSQVPRIQQTTAALTAAREELEKLRAAWQGAMGATKSQLITQDELIALETLIYELNKNPYGERRLFISEAEETALETFIYEMNKSPYGERRLLISEEEETALETLIYELNKNPYSERRLMISEEEEVALEEFIYDLNHGASRAAVQMGENFKSAFANWLGGADLGFKELLKRMAAEMITSSLFKTLGSLFAGKTGGAAGFFSSFFGGARAEGGPVSAGKGYLVGERGPELFMPGRSGMISPGGGGANIVQHIHIQAGLPPQWSAQLAVGARMAASAAHEATTKKLRGER